MVADRRERPHGPPPLDIVTPGMDALRWVILSERIHERWLHWVEGRTVPCVGDGCEWCCRAPALGEDQADAWEWGLRWKGYLAAMVCGRSKVQIVEVTENAWLECPDLEPLNVNGALRGRVIVLWRRKLGRCGRVSCILEPEPVPWSKALPPCPDVRGAVARLWRCVAWESDNDSSAGAAGGS